jgi:hypothetical protein
MTKSDQKGSREERRRHPRVVLNLPLEYRVTNIPNAQGALAVNGSEMGLLMESVKKILIGTNLKIVVLFPKEYELADFEVSAQIVWKEPYWKGDWGGYRYGLKFVSITAHDQLRLRGLLNDRYHLDELRPIIEEKVSLK